MRMPQISSLRDDSLLAFLTRLVKVLTGNVSFGNGADIDNVKGRWINVTTGGAGVETEVTHNLGEVPVGFLVARPPATGTLNMGATPWTTTKLYLTCSGATQSIVIFVLLP